ncbi:MAG: bifunctional UDP-N-acetylmuramoyl-tripeptide:D-alanyl-D-alanine ligase/alanine racemase, partial [Saprospiraceae bacterium]
IFTNIGDAHNEGFESTDQKIREKFLLFADSKIVVYCKDHEAIDRNKPSRLNSFSWSKKDESADLLVDVYKNEVHSISRIEGKRKNGDSSSITIPFTDDASIENAIHCWCMMLLLNCSQQIIQQRMIQLQPVALRLDLKAGINNCLVINDAYNLDLTSLAFALDFMLQQTQHEQMTLVLSDILQSGLSAEQLYQQVAILLSDKKVSRLIAIGKDIEIIKKFVNSDLKLQYFPNVHAFLEQFNNQHFKNETILLKGARSFEFERIAERLELKAHRTVLEINLDALQHNLAVYTTLLSKNTKVLVLVKAAAYGSGSAEVAKLLEYHKVDYFGVAYTDEAVALRKEGITVPILVLNPEESSFHSLLRYDIEPEVYSIPQLQSLIPYLAQENNKLKIHLKLDTGMHRLGFDENDIPTLLDILKQQKNLQVQSVFSHLAASDEAQHDGFTRQQAALFQKMYEAISAGIGYAPMRHLCNTGGIARFPEYHFEMVRLGIGIYGVDPGKKIQHELQVVNTLKATISQIKHIPKGETIGYGRRGLAERELSIATISVGYADGFLRSAGHGKYSVALHDKLAPVIGTICMDMCMIDITDIPEAKEGDTVIIFGNRPTVDELAAATGTISYEVFTNVSERVKRVYFRE